MTSTLGRLVRAVSDYLVLLSATPIHLRSNDLFELLKLVDEHTFDRSRAFDDILQANAPLVRARDLILGRKRPSAAGLEADVESELRQADEQPMLRGSRPASTNASSSGSSSSKSRWARSNPCSAT